MVCWATGSTLLCRLAIDRVFECHINQGADQAIDRTPSKAGPKGIQPACSGGLRLVPVNRAAFKHAADMVKQHRYSLRAGDSSHLAVALELGAKHMATLDGTLAKNAERKGLKRIVF